MVQTLENQDLARLHIDFVVPVIVGEMLKGVEILDEVAEYTLHDIISEMKPDAALLCIALCCQHIAAKHAHFPIAGIMGIEAERMVDEYAPLWLAHKDGVLVHDDEVRAQLVYLPEDLETLADFLKATATEFVSDCSTSAVLCDILSLQAEAHAASAEEELEKIHLPTLARESVDEGNVVLFPNMRMTER